RVAARCLSTAVLVDARCASLGAFDEAAGAGLGKAGAGIPPTDASAAAASIRACPIWSSGTLPSHIADETPIQKRTCARIIRRNRGAFFFAVGIAGFFRVRPRARRCRTRCRLAGPSRRLAIHRQRARRSFSPARRQNRDRPTNREPESTSEIARDFVRYNGLAVRPRRRRSIAERLSPPAGKFQTRAGHL